MELKYQWNEQQHKIIIAAKKQLERKSFEISFDVVVAVQIALERKNIPFYKGWDDLTEDLAGRGFFSDPYWYIAFCKGWDDITEDLADRDFFSNPYWYIVFCQCCASVLAENMCLQKKLRRLPTEINDFLQDLPHLPEPQHLPERLPDNQLMRAAEIGDLPQIIMRYDMIQNQGQKLKNIYHILLNKRLYDQALVLHERYGGLDKIDPEILQEHFFLQANDSEQKQLFNKFFCLEILQKTPDIWVDAHSYCILDKILEIVFECGVVPEGTVIKTSFARLPLREFLLLINELEENLEGFFPWKNVCCKMKNYMKSVLASARIYSEWDKKRKDNNDDGSAE